MTLVSVVLVALAAASASPDLPSHSVSDPAAERDREGGFLGGHASESEALRSEWARAVELFSETELAIDREIFLRDEGEILLPALCMAVDDGALESAEEDARRRGEALRKRVDAARRQCQRALDDEERFLQSLPPEVLDRLYVRLREQEVPLRREIESLDPGLGWAHASNADLLALDLEQLEGIRSRSAERRERLRAGIRSERAALDESLFRHQSEFFHQVRQWVMESGSREAREQLARADAERGADYLRRAAGTGGIERDLFVRAAFTRLRLAARSHPTWDNADIVLHQLATVARVLGEDQVVEEATRELVDRFPRSPRAPEAAGMLLAVLFRRGDHDGVLEAARSLRAQGVEPAAGEDAIHYYLGISNLAAGRTDAARENLGQVRRSSGLWPEAQLAEAAAEAALDDVDSARDRLGMLLEEIDGNSEKGEVRDRAVLALGILLFDAGRFADSADLLGRIDRSSPLAARAQLARARSTYAAGDPDRARRILLEVVDANQGSPAGAEALLALSEMEQDLGDRTTAARWLTRLIEEFEDPLGERTAAEEDRLHSEFVREERAVVRLAAEIDRLQKEAQGRDGIGEEFPLSELRTEVSRLQESVARLATSIDSGFHRRLPHLVRTAHIRLADLELEAMRELEQALAGLGRSDSSDAHASALPGTTDEGMSPLLSPNPNPTIPDSGGLQ